MKKVNLNKILASMLIISGFVPLAYAESPPEYIDYPIIPPSDGNADGPGEGEWESGGSGNDKPEEKPPNSPYPPKEEAPIPPTLNVITNVVINTTNTAELATNTTNIGKNTADITTNKTDIATNATNIGKNTADIKTNTTNIGRNTADILNLRSDVNDIYGKLSDQKSEYRSGIASIAAMANIPVVPGKTFSAGLGLGNFKNETAVAAGANWNINPNVSTKFSVGFESSNVTVGTGVAFGF